MQPNRLSVLGVGLLGGSIGLAAKKRLSDCTVVGYAHRTDTLNEALRVKAIDEGYGDPESAVRGADLVILCTPVGMLGDMLDRIAPVLSPEAVVTDVGSTKRSVVDRAARAFAGLQARFVASHPMAGSEKRGVRYALPDLFEGATCVITPEPSTDPLALESVEAFWRRLGMRTVRIGPDEHDRRIAEISHLPHALAAALVTMQEPASLALAGNGFADVTRIAGGDGGLWRDIFIDNRDNLRLSLSRLRDTLDQVVERLHPEKSDELKSWLDAAAAKREEWVKNKDEGGRMNVIDV